MQGNAFDKAKRELRAQGLIDKDNNLTSAGFDWTRDLIKRMDAAEQRRARKQRRKQEQEHATNFPDIFVRGDRTERRSHLGSDEPHQETRRTSHES